MQADSGADPDSKELLTNIKRLTRIVLDKLEEGSKEGSLRNPRPRRRVGRDLHDEIDRLYREMMQEKEDGS